MREQKTNVMRVLDQKKIVYTPHSYPHGEEAVDGVTVAALTGLKPEKVFKTLVTVGASKRNYVFVIPVAEELDLKKAAKAAAANQATLDLLGAGAAESESEEEAVDLGDDDVDESLLNGED
jgi:Cys-tRNA(Pro)/Cys-tRNA(Cys) deacylase